MANLVTIVEEESPPSKPNLSSIDEDSINQELMNEYYKTKNGIENEKLQDLSNKQVAKKTLSKNETLQDLSIRVTDINEDINTLFEQLKRIDKDLKSREKEEKRREDKFNVERLGINNNFGEFRQKLHKLMEEKDILNKKIKKLEPLLSETERLAELVVKLMNESEININAGKIIRKNKKRKKSKRNGEKSKKKKKNHGGEKSKKKGNVSEKKSTKKKRRGGKRARTRGRSRA